MKVGMQGRRLRSNQENRRPGEMAASSAMTAKRLLRSALVCALSLGAILAAGTAPALAQGDPNAGDVWVDNVGQPAGPGHEMDPHLACQDINLWANGMADSSGTFTIDGWAPSGSAELDYSGTWSYDRSQRGDQIAAVIDVGKLFKTALLNGDTPQNNQGYHFKLQFVQDPQKHKTFWISCTPASLNTTASSGTVGQGIQDTATLSGGVSPTGSMTWSLYGPNDPGCAAAPLAVYTNTKISGDGDYTSPTYTATSAGLYHWVASYSGDSRNISVSGKCGDAGETSIVAPASPAIVTSATSGVVGDSIQDTATLSGGADPTGTITWMLYGPGDGTCATPIQTFTDSTVNGDGDYTSPAYTTTATGLYHWVASYLGDTNNNAVSGSCGDTGETSTVTPQTPALSTNAVNGFTGGPINDTATLTGGDNPSGMITWNVYDQTTDPTCQTPLNSTPLSVAVDGDGTYHSPAFTATAPGSYEWVATYSGDTNNVQLMTSCTDHAEVSTVTDSSAMAPAIKLMKLEQVNSTSPNGYRPGPVHGLAGDTVDYQMTVINTGNTDLVLDFADQECDSGTLSAPTVVVGSYDATTQTLTSGGEIRYTCSHVLRSGDPSPFVNTASVVGTVPGTNQSVSDQASVDAFIDTPGIKVVKLQRDGTSGAFTPNDITASVGDTIHYEIRATNTGNVPLTLSLTDPHCDSGTVHGPTSVSGTLTGDVLSPNGVAQYTCSHVVLVGDIPSFTNVATVTGTPPHGPPVHGHGIVVAHITHAAIQVQKLASAPCADVARTVSQPAGILPCSGQFSSFTHGIIVVQLPSSSSYSIPIDYQIRVTNTGNVPLALSLDDPLCDAGTISGPTVVSGTLNGTTLSAGGAAYFTCTHTLTAHDGNTTASGQPFTNTATVTGKPASGPAVHATDDVTVNRIPPPHRKRFCRNVKTGKKVLWPKGKSMPKACRKVPAKPHHHKPSRPPKPKHPGGFTG